MPAAFHRVNVTRRPSTQEQRRKELSKVKGRMNIVVTLAENAAETQRSLNRSTVNTSSPRRFTASYAREGNSVTAGTTLQK